MEASIRWDTLTENLSEPTITGMLSVILSDYVSNSNQNAEITAAVEQTSSSPASPNSINKLDSAENATPGITWHLLEVTDYSLREWPNSNNEPISGMSTAEENASENSSKTTPVAAPCSPSILRNPLGSLTLTSSAARNPFLSAYTQQAGPSKTSNNQDENPPAQVENNPLRFILKTSRPET